MITCDHGNSMQLMEDVDIFWPGRRCGQFGIHRSALSVDCPHGLMPVGEHSGRREYVYIAWDRGRGSVFRE